MRELDNRRDSLFAMMKENSVAIIFSGVSKIASEDEFFPFVVNNSFFYLTNCGALIENGISSFILCFSTKAEIASICFE